MNAPRRGHRSGHRATVSDPAALPDAAGVPDPVGAAFAARALQDPRPAYRRMLRELKAKNGEAYRAAVAYHDEKLKPRLEDSQADPVEEWIEYGRYIADLLAPGRTVLLDRTGLAEPYRRSPVEDALLLHLPDRPDERARLLCAPVKPSAPQRATCELLAP